MTVFRLHSAHFGSDHHGQRIGNITNVIDVQTPIANTYRNYVLSSHLWSNSLSASLWPSAPAV